MFVLREQEGETAYPGTALDYLNDWAGDGKGWVRKFYPPDSDEPHFDLTPSAEKAIAWLESLGLEFVEVTGSAHTPMADESLYADRIHGTSVGANGIFTAVHDAAEAAGVEFVYDTQACRLIVQDGKVVGVEAVIQHII